MKYRKKPIEVDAEEYKIGMEDGFRCMAYGKWEEIICKCGNDKFYVGTNGEYAICSKCHTVYNNKGEEVEINNPIQEHGGTVKLEG